MFIMSELPNYQQYWDFNNPENSELKFLEIMKKAKEVNNMAYYLEVKTQLARTYSLRLQIDKAREILNEVKDELKEEYHRARICYYLELGRSYNSNKEPVKACEFFEDAMKLATEYNEENLEIDAIHMLGIAAETPKEQIKWNKLAIQKVEKSENEQVKKWLGALLNNTAWSLHDLGNYEDALNLFQKDYELRKLQKDKETELIAKWNIGRTYRSLNQLEKALKIQLEVQAERKDNGLSVGGYNQEELGEIYLLLNDKQSSKKFFKNAYEILSKDDWISKYEEERLARIRQLSE